MVEVARDEGRKELRIVRLGEYLDPYNVTVLSGLQPGDLVYVDSEQPGGGQTWAPAAPVRPAAPLRTPRY